MIRALIISTALGFLATSAIADVIDDNVIKAQASLDRAQKRLDAAKACAADRENCMATMIERAKRAADRANKKLTALTANAE